MKKLFFKIFLFLPILLFIVIFNVAVDPARIFQNSDYERKIAEALVSGNNVTDLSESNFNDRVFVKYMIQLSKKRDIAVFGSSRVMLISSEMFPGKTLLNNGLSSTSLEDFISLYEIYKERKMLPSTIIIGIDPWIFNKNAGLEKWREFGEEYYSKFLQSEQSKDFDMESMVQHHVPYQCLQLASVSYFQAGMEFLRARGYHLYSKQLFSLTHQKWNEKDTIMPDGSRTFRRNLRDVPTREVISQIRGMNAKNEALNLLGFYKMDPGLKGDFLKFILMMKADGVNVVFYLPPYNPYAYDYYMHSSQFKIVGYVEDFLKESAKAYDIDLVGSYNPHQLFLSSSSFIDDAHLRNETYIKTIFSGIILPT